MAALQQVMMPEPLPIITCEHGGNEVPAPFADLFQGQGALLNSHRGWDPGALTVAKHLASHLQAPLFTTTISRLLIDTNRSPGHPHLFSEFDRHLAKGAKKEIMARYHHPHRHRVQEAAAMAIAAGRPVIHLAIHSFTPELNGELRRAEIGLLYDSARGQERDFCLAWQAALKVTRPELRTRRNFPYLGRSDSLAAWLRGLFPPALYLGIEVEINQKELTSEAACQAIGELLVRTLPPRRPGPPLPGPTTDSPGDEVVAIVDADNRVIGQTTRREMRRQNLIHRATYILVFNRHGQLFVQKRTMGKDIYPGYYDIAAGGVVLAGESYEESARRELREELGVAAKLTFLCDRFFGDENNRVWGRVFRCRHDGPFVLQASEVESGEFMAVAEILGATGATFTPDGLAILEMLRGEGAFQTSGSPPETG